MDEMRARAIESAARAGDLHRAMLFCSELLSIPSDGGSLKVQQSAAHAMLERALADPRHPLASGSISMAQRLLRRNSAVCKPHHLHTAVSCCNTTELATLVYRATDAAIDREDVDNMPSAFRSSAFKEDSLVVDARRALILLRRGRQDDIEALTELLLDNNYACLALHLLVTGKALNHALLRRVLSRLADTALGCRPIDHVSAVAYMSAADVDDARTAWRGRRVAAGRQFDVVAALSSVGLDSSALWQKQDYMRQYHESLICAQWWQQLAALGDMYVCLRC